MCAQSSSLADISTLTRMSPSTRTQAGPHGLLPNPRLIYSAIGPSEGYISPMRPYPGGPHGRKINNLHEGGENGGSQKPTPDDMKKRKSEKK